MIEIKYDPVSVEIQTTLKVNLTFILLHVISSQETILRKKRANIYNSVQFG